MIVGVVLFDKRYVAITPDDEVWVSKWLRADWNNANSLVKSRSGDLIC